MGIWENRLFTMKVLEHLTTDNKLNFLPVKWSPSTWAIQKVGWMLAGPFTRAESSSSQNILLSKGQIWPGVWIVLTSVFFALLIISRQPSPRHEKYGLFMELVCKLRLWGPYALSRGKSGWWHWPRIYVNAKKNLDWVLEHPCSSSSCNIQWLSTSGKPSWPCKSLWAISFLS